MLVLKYVSIIESKNKYINLAITNLKSEIQNPRLNPDTVGRQVKSKICNQ